MEKKMELVQQSSDLSWIEVQFMKTAVEVLLEARGTLKWTYCLAYYLQRTNQTELFEDNQRDLEMVVEQLSELLERPIGDGDGVLGLKQDVMNKSVYVTRRREILLEDTARGLSEGRWSFNVDVDNKG
jgi:ariadne-1